MKFKLIIPVLLCLAVSTAGMGQQATSNGTDLRPQVTPNIADPRLQVRLPDVNGDTLSLISMKGKVVLLDFWASWCIPCRSSNRKLVKLYSKYKPQGFEIFAVSLDEDRKDWLKAIAKDKITWIQVNELGSSWEAKTAEQWNITAIPTSFLINRKGDILAMNLEGSELEKAVKELLAE